MDIKELRELTKLMKQYDLVELEVRDGDKEVRLSKGGAGAAPVMMATPAAAPVAPAPAAEAAGAPAPAATDEFAGCQEITSPIPGTVYLKPSPDAAAFTTVGATVDGDQVVCLVEAMKVFNEIKAEGLAGTIKKVCVEDGQAVEFGTVLFLVG